MEVSFRFDGNEPLISTRIYIIIIPEAAWSEQDIIIPSGLVDTTVRIIAESGEYKTCPAGTSPDTTWTTSPHLPSPHLSSTKLRQSQYSCGPKKTNDRPVLAASC